MPARAIASCKTLQMSKFRLRICDRLIIGRASLTVWRPNQIMIQHIVFFTAAASCNRKPIQDGLALLTKIQHARRLKIARNRKSAPLGQESTLSFMANSTPMPTSLPIRLIHYTRRRSSARPLRELRFAADYEIATARASMAENAR